MSSDKAQVDALERVLKTFDVADTRAGGSKRVHQIRIPRIRIVELQRERFAVGAGVAHQSDRSPDGHKTRGIADHAHERGGSEEARAEVGRGSPAANP